MAGQEAGAFSSAVRLRDAVPKDLEALFEFQLDPEANQMAAVIPRDRDAFMAIWARSASDPGVIAKVIEVEGRVAGSIACFKMDGLDAVGYWIAREEWGRGIATRALRLLLEQVKVRPLHARAARHNAGSIRVLEKCGFAITGYQHSPATTRYLACEEAVMLLA